jgi:hypothetical protein
MMLGRVSSTIDPGGRTVILTGARWAHIVAGHPELRSLRSDVLRAVNEPTEVIHIHPGQRWYYLAGAGPSAWLKVVVAFDENGNGAVITAFPRRSKP